MLHTYGAVICLILLQTVTTYQAYPVVNGDDPMTDLQDSPTVMIFVV